MSPARWRAALLLLALLAASQPVLARKGDIVPQPGKGVEVLTREGRKHSRTKLGPLAIEFEVTSREGFLYVDGRVTNLADDPYEFRPGQLTATSGGEKVEPLEPDNYIELAYQIKPLKVDKKGKIIEERGHVPVKVFTPGAQVPGTTSGASLAEQMASDQWEEGSHEQRVQITKELQAMKKDMLRYGGKLASGDTAKGRLVVQRNQVELPLDVHFVVGSRKLTVRFVRGR